MKKQILYKLSIIVVTLCLAFSIVACDKPANQNGQESQDVEQVSSAVLASSLVVIEGNTVIITADADYMNITNTTVLIDYMQKLKTDGALNYTVREDGMINSINGQENPADWSKCWMLYSNDAELTNEAWGTVTVGETTYFSAVLGAEALPIKDGKIYVWEFKSF